MKTAVLCTCALALLLFGLSLLISLLRLQRGQGLGVPEEPGDLLHRASVAQSNTVQYAPMLAILMLTLQTYGAPAWTIWLSVLAVIGRYLYATAMLTAADIRKPTFLKITGMTLTYLTGFLMAGALFYQTL